MKNNLLLFINPYLGILMIEQLTTASTGWQFRYAPLPTSSTERLAGPKNGIRLTVHPVKEDVMEKIKNDLLESDVERLRKSRIIARTYSSSHSLAGLIEDLVVITLDKKQQTTFWGKTQLTPEQIEYASNDVKYLIGVRTQLETILAQKGLLSTGISYTDLNKACQSCIPTLVHIWMNGWDFGKEDSQLIFGR